MTYWDDGYHDIDAKLNELMTGEWIRMKRDDKQDKRIFELGKKVLEQKLLNEVLTETLIAHNLLDKETLKKKLDEKILSLKKKEDIAVFEKKEERKKKKDPSEKRWDKLL